VPWKQFRISYMPFIYISEGIVYMRISLPYRAPKTNWSATVWVLLLTAYTRSSDSLNWCMQVCSVLRFSTLSFPTFVYLLLGLTLCLCFQKLPFFSRYRCTIVPSFHVSFFYRLEVFARYFTHSHKCCHFLIDISWILCSYISC